MRQVSKSVKLVSEEKIVAVIAPCDARAVTKGKSYPLRQPVDLDAGSTTLVGKDNGYPAYILLDYGCAHLDGGKWIPVIKTIYRYVPIGNSEE